METIVQVAAYILVTVGALMIGNAIGRSERRALQGPTSKPRTPFAPRLAALVVDGAIVAGAGSITYGAWLIYQPLGFIAGGAFLLAGGWLFASRGEPA